MSEVPLKEYVESLVKWLDRYSESRIEAIHASTKEAKEQIDKRLEGMNEFRDSLNDLTGRLATKEEVRALEKSIDARLKLLELRDARIAGMAAVVAVIVSAVVSAIWRFV